LIVDHVESEPASINLINYCLSYPRGLPMLLWKSKRFPGKTPGGRKWML